MLVVKENSRHTIWDTPHQPTLNSHQITQEQLLQPAQDVQNWLQDIQQRVEALGIA